MLYALVIAVMGLSGEPIEQVQYVEERLDCFKSGLVVMRAYREEYPEALVMVGCTTVQEV